MADVHTKAIRSYNMSQIRGKNTKPEILVRKFLFSKGFRYRIHDKKLPGKPDIVLPKYKTVIFVNGCFWHGHVACKYYVVPSTNPEWWLEKINRNKVKDARNNLLLINAGWNVIELWECSLKSAILTVTLHKLINMLKK